MEPGTGIDYSNTISEEKIYNEAFEPAIAKARLYDGSEEAYVSLMDSLGKLEDVAKGLPSLQATNAHDRELAAALKFRPDDPMDIQQLLVLAIHARNDVLHDSLVAAEDEPLSPLAPSPEEKERKTKLPPILISRVGGILLPTKPQGLHEPGLEAKSFEGPRFEERLGDLLSILESIGVFSDDIIVMVGKVDPNTMRRKSYAAVRIPRLDRSVLVCDQINEATFVVRGDISAKELLGNNKDDLQKILGPKIEKVERVTKASWEKRIHDLLISDSAWDNPDQPIKAVQPKQKIDVHQFQLDDLRIKAAQTIGPPEAWPSISAVERRTLFVEGMSVTKVSRFFGVTGNPLYTNSDWLRLGLAIYPDNPFLKKQLEIEDLTPELCKTKLQEIYTPEKWLQMSKSERQNFKMEGAITLDNLAQIFKIEDKRQARAVKMPFLQIGLKIWPDNELIKKQLEIEKRSPDQWRSVVITQLTPEKWATMQQKEKWGLKIDGVGLQKLGGIFGIVGGAANDPILFYELGLKIWPNNILIKEAQESYRVKHEAYKKGKELTDQEWIDKIRQIYSPEEWMQIKRRGFNIDDFSIVSLANKLGATGDVLMDSGFYHLSTIIFPENEMFKQKLAAAEKKANETADRSEERWRGIVIQTFAPEKWLQIKGDNIRDIKINGLKLTALATIFGIKKYSFSDRKAYLRLGLAIWPGNELIQKELDKFEQKP